MEVANSEILNETFSKFCSTSEHLVVGEVIILFKERVIFRRYHPMKHKHFDIKMYKPCDETGYTYNMTVYSFLDGGEEIPYGVSRFILVNDMLQSMAQVGRNV